MTDFSDPEQRLDYLLQHGVDAYNKAMEDHFAKTVVETVSGHPIRLVHTMRFGALYMVDGSTAATRPWTAPARSRVVKHDGALSRRQARHEGLGSKLRPPTQGSRMAASSSGSTWRRRIGRASPAGTVCSSEAGPLIQIKGRRTPAFPRPKEGANFVAFLPHGSRQGDRKWSTRSASACGAALTS